MNIFDWTAAFIASIITVSFFMCVSQAFCIASLEHRVTVLERTFDGAIAAMQENGHD